MPIRSPPQARILFRRIVNQRCPQSKNSGACVGHVFCRVHGVAFVVELPLVPQSSSCQHYSSSSGVGFQIVISVFAGQAPNNSHPAQAVQALILTFLPCLSPFPPLVPSWFLPRFPFPPLHPLASRGSPPHPGLNSTEFNHRTREHAASLGHSGN